MMLEGVKVLDFSQYYPGPFATLRLQDWGAEVIKIEPPQGDNSRFYKCIGDDEGVAYQALNRGKQSVALNLKNPDGLATARKLVLNADVLVEGYRPGVMDRLGLGYEDVSALNPGIVYCSITGYGQQGSLHAKSGHDLNYLALSGVLSLIEDKDRRPVVPKVAFVDAISGICASEAILAALVRKFREGSGYRIDVAMAECAFLLQTLALAESRRFEEDVPSPANVSYNIYETKDGRFVTIAAMEPKFWKAFCDAMGRPDLIEGHCTPAVDSNPAFIEMKKCIADKTFAEWVDFFYAEDCCFAPVYTPDEAADSRFVRDRHLVENRWGLSHMKTHFTGNDPLPDYPIPIARLGENLLGL